MKEHNQHYTSGFEACGFYINKTFIHSLTPNALNTSNLVHWISFFRNLTIIFRASIRTIIFALSIVFNTNTNILDSLSSGKTISHLLEFSDGCLHAKGNRFLFKIELNFRRSADLCPSL